jgi:hypothetical protein
MRTTIELPDELFAAAKIAAVQRKTTLKALIGAALAKELGVTAPAGARTRVEFPLFESKRPGWLKLTDRAIRRDEAESDLRRLGLPR